MTTIARHWRGLARADQADAYVQHLRSETFPAIQALPGFLDAQVFEVVEPPPAPGRITLCTQYRLRDEAALQDYFDRHAARLRGDGIARFGGRFSASRRVLRPS